MTDWQEGLVPSDLSVVADIAEKIKSHLGRSIEHAYLAGVELQRSRVVLKEEHRWVAWIENEFKPGWRVTAWRLMTMAEKLEKPYRKGTLFQFATSAAYELTRPSAPEEALNRAIDEAEAGKPITHSRAKELVHQQREEDKAAAAAALGGLPPEQQESIKRGAREKAERDVRRKNVESGLAILQQARDIFDAMEGKRARTVIRHIDAALGLAKKMGK